MGSCLSTAPYFPPPPHHTAAQGTKPQESWGIYPTQVQVLHGRAWLEPEWRVLSGGFLIPSSSVPDGLRNISLCSLKNKCGEMRNNAKDVAALSHFSKGSAQNCPQNLLGLCPAALISFASCQHSVRDAWGLDVLHLNVQREGGNCKEGNPLPLSTLNMHH